MARPIAKRAGLVVMLALCTLLGGCDDVRVYGSVGYSTYSGYGYPGRGGLGTSVTIGGRIY